MDTTYSVNRGNGNYKWLILTAVVILLLGGVGYYIFGSTKRFVSPLPEEPSMEIIFYTPTPEPVTPTSSPSATPKAGIKPSPTKKPTTVPSVSPTAEASKTPTPTI